MGFSWAAVNYGSAEAWPELLWICNVSNLLLAAGLLSRSGTVTWVATLWLLVGMPLWLWDGLTDAFASHSFVTHVGSATVGLLSLSALDKRRRVWWMALGYATALQWLSRAVTPPGPNVNSAHTVYRQLTGVFSSYPTYWVVSFIGLLVVFAVLERVVERVVSTGRGSA